MRCLKLDDATIRGILDDLDALVDQRVNASRGRDRRFPYRVRGVRVDFRVSRDVEESFEVVTRNIGRDGISFIAGHVVHMSIPCEIHLIGIQQNTQSVTAKVKRCRYIQGTACAHEIDCVFDKPIDPASFAATAIRARVLLADASPMSRRLVAHLFEPLNVELACVDNGITAVQRALAEPFDLILMDSVLPKLDGLNAARFLRKKGYLRPMCALSSKTTHADRDACLAAGFEDFLPKPPKRTHLEAVIQRTRPQPLVSSLLDKADMRPLIDEFVLELLERASLLESAFSADDVDRLMHVAMSIKADAGGFGFEMITEAAGEVEATLASGVSPNELRPKLCRLVRLCQAARPATCEVDIDTDIAGPLERGTLDDLDEDEVTEQVTAAEAVEAGEGAEELDLDAAEE